MKRTTRAGVVLGLALGGFFDGIVFHQVLRWHHMISAISGDIHLNMMADGFFHAVAWVLALVGVILLWAARHELPAAGSGRALGGGMLLGAGSFNLVEGLIDHHLLGVHRVNPASDAALAWDIGFLALGLALVLAGWALLKDRDRAPTGSRAHSGPPRPPAR
ncbi:MAG: DUF2243 domain-containing protein [Alphaproteobacteria bacterium]|nr:DUF2243 domain-containing protein [Alphaproteobacteria bacterium]